MTTHEVRNAGELVCTIEEDVDANTATFTTANGAHGITYTADDLEDGDVHAMVLERLAEYRDADLDVTSS